MSRYQMSIFNAYSREKFHQWSIQRPFWAGLFLIIGAAAMLLPCVSSVTIGDLTLTLSNDAGVKIVFLTAVLTICGVVMWINPVYRIPAGVIGLIMGILSLQSANFGGFGIGLICSIIGSALGLSWYNTSEISPNATEDTTNTIVEDEKKILHPKSISSKETSDDSLDTPNIPFPAYHDADSLTKHKTTHKTTDNTDDTNNTGHHRPATTPKSAKSHRSAKNFPTGLSIIIAVTIACLGLLPYRVDPRNVTHASPNYILAPSDALWLIVARKATLTSIAISGVGTLPNGYKYLRLTLGNLNLTDFSLSYSYGHGFRTNLTTPVNSHTYGIPFAHSTATLLIRSLRGDLTLNGTHFGKWVIDTNGVPMQLLHLLGIPDFSLPNNLVNTLILKDLQIESYSYQVGEFMLPSDTHITVA